MFLHFCDPGKELQLASKECGQRKEVLQYLRPWSALSGLTLTPTTV